MSLGGLLQGLVVFELPQPFLLSFVVDPISHILNEADILSLGRRSEGHESEHSDEEGDQTSHGRGFS